jgi:vacuolar-type H+-ATPase catalytic subunit A/Vma1
VAVSTSGVALRQELDSALADAEANAATAERLREALRAVSDRLDEHDEARAEGAADERVLEDVRGILRRARCWGSV